MVKKHQNTSIVETGTHGICPAITVLLLSIIFMVLGFTNGEIESYFQKAVLVCTQCIGLG